MSAIDKFIQKEGPKRLMQVEVSISLWERVDKIRRKKGLKWNELVTALFERLVYEEK